MRTFKVAFSEPRRGKIPAGSPEWPRFNASFENLQLGEVEIGEAIVNGRPITTWHANRWRASQNYLAGQHIGIDFDTGDDASRISTLVNDPFVARYGHMVHTTPSHTELAPRARVLFLLEQPFYDAARYTWAVASLLWLFSAADKQCKDPVRFFYGMAPGGQYESLGNVLPMEKLADIMKRYRVTGRTQKRRMDRGNGHHVPADQARVRDALAALDPWAVGYDDWLAVLMAIHSEWPGEDGLALAETWGDGKPGEIATKWRSFKAQGNANGQVSMGTLFALANQNGWH